MQNKYNIKFSLNYICEFLYFICIDLSISNVNKDNIQISIASIDEANIVVCYDEGIFTPTSRTIV